MSDARLRELWAKIERFGRVVEARHGDEMPCRKGCHACCVEGLTVTRVEAEAIVEAVATLGEEARALLRRNLEAPRGEGCVALDDDGACLVYEGRPLVCRTHGLPLRLKQARGLPVLDACNLCFTRTPLSSLDRSLVLDQTTLSTILFAIDAAASDADGAPRGERFSIDDVLRAALTAP